MSTYKHPYTTNQLAQYVAHIQLPSKYHFSNNPMLNEEFLSALHVHQISTIPYENLSLHYSPDHKIELDAHVLFDKFINKGRNRGGYCLEVGLFFLFILRSYGFDVYATGARMRSREDGVPSGDFIGLVHIVLVCTLATGVKYILDPACGGDGPTDPLRLIENHPTQNLGIQEVRYIHEALPQNAPRSFSAPQKYWIYQYRNGLDHPWTSLYCFTETEYLVNDFNVLNAFACDGQKFQRDNILMVKFIRTASDNEGARIAGKVMLHNDLIKRNLGGKTEVVQKCQNEEARIMAINHWFGITLDAKEREGIKGLVTELLDRESIAIQI